MDVEDGEIKQGSVFLFNMERAKKKTKEKSEFTQHFRSKGETAASAYLLILVSIWEEKNKGFWLRKIALPLSKGKFNSK